MKKYMFLFVFIAPFAFSMTMDDAKLSPEVQGSINKQLYRNEAIKVVYLSSENLVVSHSNTGRIRLWNLDPKTPNEAELLDHELAPNEMEVFSVDINVVSQRILISPRVGESCEYGVINSQALKNIRTNLGNASLLNRSQSKSGNFIVTWDSYKKVQLWDNKGDSLDYDMASSKVGVTKLAFNEEENAVLVTGKDGVTTKHNIVNAKALNKIYRNMGIYSEVVIKKQSKSGKYVATVDSIDCLKLYDDNGESIDSRMAMPVKNVQDIDFDEEENMVMLTHTDGVVSTFDIISKTVVEKMNSASDYFSFEKKKRSKDGKYVVSLSSNSYVELWGKSGDRMKRFTLGDIDNFGFKDDNKTAFIQCKDGYYFECKIPDNQ